MDLHADTIEIKLPFPGFLSRKKVVGFRFSIAAYALMCRLYEPPLELNQIEEAQKQGKDKAIIKLVTGAAIAYATEKRVKNLVTEELVKWWFNNLKGHELTSFLDAVNVAILNGESRIKQELKPGTVKKK